MQKSMSNGCVMWCHILEYIYITNIQRESEREHRKCFHFDRDLPQINVVIGFKNNGGLFANETLT